MAFPPIPKPREPETIDGVLTWLDEAVRSIKPAVDEFSDLRNTRLRCAIYEGAVRRLTCIARRAEKKS